MTTDAEKAAEEYARSIQVDKNYPFELSGVAYFDQHGKRITFSSIFLAGAAWAAPKWVSVKERLPEAEEDVLLCGCTGFYFGWLSLEECDPPKFCNFIDSEIGGITHWMPLPDAPKGEK